MPDSSLVAVVEIPKGSSNKYEWDEELGAIKLDRLLFSSLGYPTDYGFFRNTLAGDGDPLDAMIVVSEPTFPGCLIEVKPVALFRMRDEKAEDNKILCVPHTDPNWSHIEQLDDLPMTLRDEIAHFFSIYKTPEWKVVARRRLVPPRRGARVDRARSTPVGGHAEQLAGLRLLRRGAGAVGAGLAHDLAVALVRDDLDLDGALLDPAQVDRGLQALAAAHDLDPLAGDGHPRRAQPRAAQVDHEAPPPRGAAVATVPEAASAGFSASVPLPVAVIGAPAVTG